MRKTTLALIALVGFLALGASALAAQEVLPGELLARQELRASKYVYTAYAIAIVLIMVWAGSIAKRLSDLESRLGG